MEYTSTNTADIQFTYILTDIDEEDPITNATT